MQMKETTIYLYDGEVIYQTLTRLATFMTDNRYDDLSVIIQRGWKHGGHLKVVYGHNNSQIVEEFEQTLDRVLNEIVNAFQTEQPIDYEKYAVMIERVAILENFQGTYLPLKKQFKVETKQYIEPENMKEGFYFQEEILKTEMIIHSAPFYYHLTETEKNIFLLKLMIVFSDYSNTLEEGHGAINESYFSFKSHYEGFKAQLINQPEQMRTQIIQKMQMQTDDEKQFVYDEFTSFLSFSRNYFKDYQGKDKGILILFQQIVKKLEKEYRESLEQNKISFEEEQLLERFMSDNRDQLSEYHQQIMEQIDVSIFSEKRFLLGRLVVNWFYSMLPLYSVSPLRKHKLCNLLCIGIENKLNKDSSQLVTELANTLQKEF